MPRNIFFLFAIMVLMGLTLGASRADDQTSTTESRLRDALKNTLLQLRDAQNQIATLQAAQAQSDKDNADLKAKLDALNGQLEALTKQSESDKETSDKTIAGLNSQVTDQTGQITRLNQALTEWKAAYNQVAQLATAKESARAQLAIQAAILQRTVDDREAKNLALFTTGNEILVRYEKFGLGDALSAKEPFVGTTRVKLETLVQDYKDKLLNQKVIPGQPLPMPEPAATTSGKPPANPGHGPVPPGKAAAKA
jgi:chromosome segregation ATPase